MFDTSRSWNPSSFVTLTNWRFWGLMASWLLHLRCHTSTLCLTTSSLRNLQGPTQSLQYPSSQVCCIRIYNYFCDSTFGITMCMINDTSGSLALCWVFWKSSEHLNECIYLFGKIPSLGNFDWFVKCCCWQMNFYDILTKYCNTITTLR